MGVDRHLDAVPEGHGAALLPDRHALGLDRAEGGRKGDGGVAFHVARGEVDGRALEFGFRPVVGRDADVLVEHERLFAGVVEAGARRKVGALPVRLADPGGDAVEPDLLRVGKVLHRALGGDLVGAALAVAPGELRGIHGQPLGGDGDIAELQSELDARRDARADDTDREKRAEGRQRDPEPPDAAAPRRGDGEGLLPRRVERGHEAGPAGDGGRGQRVDPEMLTRTR